MQHIFVCGCTNSVLTCKWHAWATTNGAMVPQRVMSQQRTIQADLPADCRQHFEANVLEARQRLLAVASQGDGRLLTAQPSSNASGEMVIEWPFEEHFRAYAGTRVLEQLLHSPV